MGVVYGLSYWVLMEQYLIVDILVVFLEDDIDALLAREEAGSGRMLNLRVVGVQFKVVYCRQSLFLAAVDQVHLYI